MKYCSYCGAELMDEAVVCPKCGCPVDGQSNNRKVQDDPDNISGLKIAAKIFMIISTVCYGFLIVPLIWLIPMTVSYCDKIKNHEHVGLSFKICTLLFANQIAGILMLCDNED